MSALNRMLGRECAARRTFRPRWSWDRSLPWVPLRRTGRSVIRSAPPARPRRTWMSRTVVAGGKDSRSAEGCPSYWMETIARNRETPIVPSTGFSRARSPWQLRCSTWETIPSIARCAPGFQGFVAIVSTPGFPTLPRPSPRVPETYGSRPGPCPPSGCRTPSVSRLNLSRARCAQRRPCLPRRGPPPGRGTPAVTFPPCRNWIGKRPSGRGNRGRREGSALCRDRLNRPVRVRTPRRTNWFARHVDLPHLNGERAGAWTGHRPAHRSSAR